jgi:hypothetical protein
MESPGSPTELPRRQIDRLGISRRPGEHWETFAQRIANAYGLVLLLVVATYVLGSLAPFGGWGGVALAAVASGCATMALVSAEASQRTVRAAAVLALAATILSAVAAIWSVERAAAIEALIVVVLLAVAATKVLGTVVGAEEVGFRTILGAICVYVILGLLFTFVYAGVDRLQSGQFFGTDTHTGDFLFFSITTLTTTGYGNLVPAAQPGKMLSGLEMLIGQIFLVTLIAGLVSLWRPGLGGRRQ